MKVLRNFFLISIIALSGCGSDEFAPADNGYAYFPLKTGDFRVYEIHETVYSEVNEPVSRTYQLRTIVADSFPSGDNTYTYVVHRFTRPDETMAWESLDSWSARSNGRELIVNEGNTSFVKLVFPPRAGLEWDGNKFNNLGEDKYKIVLAGVPHGGGETTFENCLRIELEENDDRIVFFDVRAEAYAYDVGLIYKETAQLRYCTLDECLGQEVIESGIILNQHLVDYGSMK